MRINELKIRGFRGFNREQSIPFDSNVILIYGLNGSGKSSLTEALEWLFFGEISRQRLSRCRSEYQYEEYLRNLFYTDVANPYVEVQGSLRGKSVKIRKEITPEGDKYFVDDREVSDLNGLNLDLESYFRPMLAQTEIKALVDSEQKERWEQLSSILGQDKLTRLREYLITLKNNKKDENYRKQELKWQTLLSDINDIPDIACLGKPIQLLEAGNLLSETKRIIGSSATTLKDILREVRDRQKALLNTELGRRVVEISYKDSADLNRYLSELTANFEKLEEYSIASTKEGHDYNYLNFLEKGLGLANIPECPFCLERTLTVRKVESIKKTLEQGRDTQKAKSEFDRIKDSIDSWMRSFPERIKLFFPSDHELKIISQKFIDIDEGAIAAQIQDIGKNISLLTKNFVKELQIIIDGFFSYIEKKYFHRVTVDESIREKVDIVIKRIISQQEDPISKWEALKLQIGDKLSFEGQADQKEVKKWLILDKVISFFVGADGFIKYTNLLKRVDSIQRKLEEYEKNEVSRLLKEHASEIKSYYEKLNPGDAIQFSGIEVKGGKRRQAKLKAEAFGKEVNPVTFFSEAHTNSLALSVYFPQRVDRNDTWEVVMLDDPVQSMDENHSQALIDILFDVVAKKQIMVLTHSKSFFRRLCARFRHLKPKIYSFYNDEEKGPSIVLDEGETSSYLTLIEEDCKKGDIRSLETASHHLRKAIESVCVEFLLDKGVSFSKAHKLQGRLSSLFMEAEKLGLPISEIGKLKSLLDTSHSDSHAWSIADTTRGGIRSGEKYIQEIYNNYLK